MMRWAKPERMYIYHYRLFDRYHRRVASLAVLGDERPGWRPDQFGYALWGCSLGSRVPAVKLLDYREQSLMSLRDTQNYEKA